MVVYGFNSRRERKDSPGISPGYSEKGVEKQSVRLVFHPFSTNTGMSDQPGTQEQYCSRLGYRIGVVTCIKFYFVTAGKDIIIVPAGVWRPVPDR